MDDRAADDNADARIFVRVSGRVQGVGFRYFVLRVARQLNVSGWVKNDSDGTVVVEAVGNRASLRRLLDQLEIGPRASRVDSLQARWSKAESDGTNVGFEIR